jgi:uncharacterized protein
MSETPVKLAGWNNENYPDEVRRRLRIAARTAERNARAINARTPPGYMTSLNQRINQLVHGGGSIEPRLRAVYAVADELNSFNGANVACRRGCSHCCHIAVTLTEVEANLIGKAIGRTPQPEVAKDWATRADSDAFDYGYHNPCVFLKGGECSIYADRPLVCRMLVNADRDALLCQLLPPGPGPAVPYLDRRPLARAFAEIGLQAGPPGQRVADIREYFPSGGSEPAPGPGTNSSAVATEESPAGQSA